MKSPNPVCERCISASCGLHIPEMERVFGDTGKPQFKGSGFYETDYKKKKTETKEESPVGVDKGSTDEPEGAA